MPALPPQFLDSFAGPAVIVAADLTIVHLNGPAQALWNAPAEGLAGRGLVEALGLEAAPGEGAAGWAEAVLAPALAGEGAVDCQATAGDGRRHAVRVASTRFAQDGMDYLAISIAPSLDWALRDPLTGLANRHGWQEAAAERDAAGGAVVFFDLDGLKALNDAAGHARGDEALAALGRALVQEAPMGARAFRFGGDEFLVLLEPDATQAHEAFANAVVGALVAGLGEGPAPGVSYGLATFGPGGLTRAMAEADEDLYARRGVLLRGQLGGRILLQSRAVVPRLMAPGRDPAGGGPGAFAAGLGPDFDRLSREALDGALEQAQAFVELIGPEPGSAVVEVGAGTGRISLEGGLAERVGPGGQLLLTDPSLTQLQGARQRAEALGLNWVRLLAAPAEHLPLASDTVDLVFGAMFLHFTDHAAALASMARITRRGGRVALNAALGMAAGPAWQVALGPVRRALAGMGRPLRRIHPDRETLEALIAGAGLVIERVAPITEGTLRFARPEAALAVFRQSRLVPLLLREVPELQQQGLQEEAESAFRLHVEAAGMAAAATTVTFYSMVARKP